MTIFPSQFYWRRKTAKIPLTDEERDQMAHAIGHPSATGSSVTGGRNHYVTSTDDQVWAGLVKRKLATATLSEIVSDGETLFMVTRAGRDAVEDDPRSRKEVWP